MRVLATLTPDSRGISDSTRYTTYGGDIIPRADDGGLDIVAVWADGDPPAPTVWAYDASIIKITGGFCDIPL